jgi:hypothetical protein
VCLFRNRTKILRRSKLGEALAGVLPFKFIEPKLAEPQIGLNINTFHPYSLPVTVYSSARPFSRGASNEPHGPRKSASTSTLSIHIQYQLQYIRRRGPSQEGPQMSLMGLATRRQHLHFTSIFSTSYSIFVGEALLKRGLK